MIDLEIYFFIINLHICWIGQPNWKGNLLNLFGVLQIRGTLHLEAGFKKDMG